MQILMEEMSHAVVEMPGEPLMWPNQSGPCTAHVPQLYLVAVMENSLTSIVLCEVVQQEDSVRCSMRMPTKQQCIGRSSGDLLAPCERSISSPAISVRGGATSSSLKCHHHLAMLQNSLHNLTTLIHHHSPPTACTVELDVSQQPGSVDPLTGVMAAEPHPRRDMWTFLKDSFERVHDDLLKGTNSAHRQTPHLHTNKETCLIPNRNTIIRIRSSLKRQRRHRSDYRKRPEDTGSSSTLSGGVQSVPPLHTCPASGLTAKCPEDAAAGVSVPTVNSLLKTMQKALVGLNQATETPQVAECSKPTPAASTSSTSSTPSTSSQSLFASATGKLKLKRPHVCVTLLDDDELPDLDEPVRRQCTCRSTSGNTVIMCRACRLSPTAPPRKMRKKRHFLDILSVCANIKMGAKKDSDRLAIESKGLLEHPLPSSGYSMQATTAHNSRPSGTTIGSCTDPEEDVQAMLLQMHISRTVRGQTRNIEPEIPSDARMVTRKLSEMPSYCSVPFHAELLMAPGDKHIRPFPVLKIGEARRNIIEGVQEEAVTCKSLAMHVVKLVRDSITLQFEAPDELIRDLFATLADSKDMALSYSIYNVLETTSKMHPPSGSIPFIWTDLENIMSRLRLPYGVKNIATHEAVSNILALRLIVSYLETDLRNRSLASQLRMIKSAAYKWLSTDFIFAHVKQLIQWITLALRYGDLEDKFISFRKLTQPGKYTLCDKDVPKVLPCLQKLLDLSLTIAKRPDDSARRIAIELVHMFRCLPSLHTRHLFLTTITSPLLKLTLCQRLLEDQCGVDSCGVHCLHDVLQADFTAKPPRNSLTPPPTPSDDDDDDEEDGDDGTRKPVVAFHDEGWEELTLLLYTVVSSYLATVKARLRYPLWKRVLDHPLEVLGIMDKKTLKKLPGYVTKLRGRIESNLAQMSPRTRIYLVQLECLADLQ